VRSAEPYSATCVTFWGSRSFSTVVETWLILQSVQWDLSRTNILILVPCGRHFVVSGSYRTLCVEIFVPLHDRANVTSDEAPDRRVAQSNVGFGTNMIRNNINEITSILTVSHPFASCWNSLIRRSGGGSGSFQYVDRRPSASAFAPLLGKLSLTKPLDQYPKSYSANICNVNYRRGGAKRTWWSKRGKDTGSA
jgi:uncharacterized protein (DUF736 family)